MSKDLLVALEQLEKEKGISKESIISAIEEALNASYSKKDEDRADTRVEFDEETGDIKLFARKVVVEEVTDDSKEFSLEEAREIDPEFEIGEIAEFEITPSNFGRLASQKAKQVIIQKLREEERNMIYDQYITKEKEVVTGKIQRTDTRTTGEKIVYVDLGKTEAIMLPSEQIPGENYKFGDTVKVYVVKVEKTTKDPKILVSRTHPNLVRRLFEMEIPEVANGIVEIKDISREAGSRSKVCVYCEDESIEPIGACVGPKGTRIQTINDELKGERIDIVEWSDDPAVFIGNSLSPAKIVSVDIDEEDKSAKVIVPDAQLSLAIGKKGQNARLAAKLTGWKIDIKSESQANEQTTEEIAANLFISDDVQVDENAESENAESENAESENVESENTEAPVEETNE